jgi:HTH-type transcriptional regulator, competence development regulator
VPQNKSFGALLRARRRKKKSGDASFSLRKLAERVGIEPSYLSKIERGQESPPGEDTICRIAAELGEDSDTLLALGGKVSSDLVQIIRERPALMAKLLRSVRRAPAKHVVEISKHVREGKW